MKIGIKRINKLKLKTSTIIECIIVFFCLMGTIQLFGAPHSIEYVLDGLLIFLLYEIFKKNKFKLMIVQYPIICQGIMLIIGVMVSIANHNSWPCIMWSLRNLGRFIVFFGGCTVFLEHEDYLRIFKILEWVFFLNFFMIIYEYFVLGMADDDLGGVFGATQTTNGDLNVFLLVMTVYFMVMWAKKSISFFKLSVVLLIDTFIAVLSELKFVFFEMVLIFLLVYAISQLTVYKRTVSLKWIVLILVLLVVGWGGISMLGKIYPHWNGFFSVDKIMTEITREGGYTNKGDINRITFFSTINKSVFTDVILRIEGIGLGGAEFSGRNSIFLSEFYKQYEYLHYYYFSLSWMYIECGLIGVLLYLLSFILMATKGVNKLYNMRLDSDWEFELMAVVTAFMAILLLVYNQSMRLSSAYLVYFVIAYIFIKPKEDIVSDIR